jgi:hypothetical protein
MSDEFKYYCMDCEKELRGVLYHLGNASLCMGCLEKHANHLPSIDTSARYLYANHTYTRESNIYSEEFKDFYSHRNIFPILSLNGKRVHFFKKLPREEIDNICLTNNLSQISCPECGIQVIDFDFDKNKYNELTDDRIYPYFIFDLFHPLPMCNKNIIGDVEALDNGFVLTPLKFDLHQWLDWQGEMFRGDKYNQYLFLPFSNKTYKFNRQREEKEILKKRMCRDCCRRYLIDNNLTKKSCPTLSNYL